jgi:hypothetical protein
VQLDSYDDASSVQLTVRKGLPELVIERSENEVVMDSKVDDRSQESDVAAVEDHDSTSAADPERPNRPSKENKSEASHADMDDSRHSNSYKDVGPRFVDDVHGLHALHHGNSHDVHASSNSPENVVKVIPEHPESGASVSRQESDQKHEQGSLEAPRILMPTADPGFVNSPLPTLTCSRNLMPIPSRTE